MCPGVPSAGPASAWRLSLQHFRASYCQALELVGKGLSTVMMKQGLISDRSFYDTPSSGTVSASWGTSWRDGFKSTPCPLSHGADLASCTRARVAWSHGPTSPLVIPPQSSLLRLTLPTVLVHRVDGVTSSQGLEITSLPWRYSTCPSQALP